MKHAPWIGGFGGLLALLLATTSTWSQSVLVVAGDGSGDHLQLQAAISAAAAGDVILVRPHTERYDFATLDGKPLTLVGDGDVRPELEDLRIRNLAPGEVVTLRFLDIEGRSAPTFFLPTQFVGLELDDNDGCVWLEDLVVAGANGIPKWGGSETGWRGLDVDDSACVVVVDTEVVGGFGAHSVGGSTYLGGDGGLLTNSRVALHGCTFTGGRGGDEVLHPAAQGGIGIDCTSSELFTSGSSLIGGDTGDVFLLPTSDPTASGLVVRDGADVQHLATTFASGGGQATPGPPIEATGTPSIVEDLDDDHRAIKTPAVVRELTRAHVSYSGEPGDLVLLSIASTPDWAFVPALKGVQHLGAAPVQAILGTAGADGTLVAAFQSPRVPAGTDAATGFAQAVVAETDGGIRLGAPSSILIVSASIPGP